MPIITRSALVSHSTAEMYSLVCDVDAYPQFLPWCAATRVIEQSDTEQIASITIDKRMKSATFTTRNSLEENAAIHMQLIEGPFRQLRGVWRFKALDQSACRVELEVNFEFKTRMFAVLMGPAFSKICDTMVDSFVRRADQLWP